MPAKRIFNVDDFLILLNNGILSTGEISRKIRCNRGTALKYLKELKAKKQVLETRISNTVNMWRLNGTALPKKPHVAYNGGNNEWYTPEPYIKAAVGVMGAIDLDPASSIFANNVVSAKKFYTIEDDGLTQQWRGRVWLNPPYASELITKFCNKLRDHFVASEVTEAIVLVNNATETAWFNTLVQCASAVVFTTSRVRFYAPDGKKSQPLQGQAVIYLGKNKKKFIEYFGAFGWHLLV